LKTGDRKQGVEVFAVVPLRPEQKPEENLDGITVLGFPQFQPWEAMQLYRKCNADIYHSQEASLGSYLAMNAMPHKKHLITFRDHKLFRDWLVELKHPSRSHLRTLLAWIYERNYLVGRAIHKSDRLAVCAPHLTHRLIKRYHLQQQPLSTLLNESWILVNTSLREGLPTSFLEAMGHRCALLSRVNPDDVASRFGFHVENDDFATGLANLLDGDTWRDKGKAGFHYVKDTYELGNVMQKHLQAYQELMQG
jgi:hypothetical protein